MPTNNEDSKCLARISIPAKVRDGVILTPSVEIRLGEDYKWVPTRYSEHAALIAELATIISSPPHYTYSTSDGAPGYMIAGKVNQSLGGRLLLPPVKHSPTGTIH